MIAAARIGVIPSSVRAHPRPRNPRSRQRAGNGAACLEDSSESTTTPRAPLIPDMTPVGFANSSAALRVVGLARFDVFGCLLWSFVYLVVRNLFALVWLLGRQRRSKELELLILATGSPFLGRQDPEQVAAVHLKSLRASSPLRRVSERSCRACGVRLFGSARESHY